MNYRDREKTKAKEILDHVIRAAGNGEFDGRHYDFVLEDGLLNLWDGIREDALDYFRENGITWWRGGPENKPTGHLFSSQVACLNHLYWLRARKDAALAIARQIHPGIVDIDEIDSGYVGFEVVGKDNYLGERAHSRGANATAFDAVIIGKKESGENCLIAIEWKYTEVYDSTCLYKPARAEIYDHFLDDENGPIEVSDKTALYYEPFYQLMRQILLSWKIVEAGDYGCDEYLHVHVIPKENRKLLETTEKLPGKTLTDAWRGVLKEPERYRIVDPQELLRPAKKLPASKAILRYLENRYWRSMINCG
jgi:hypothetical protein